MIQHGKRPTIASRHGIVAAAHPLAAAAGARILSARRQRLRRRSRDGSDAERRRALHVRPRRPGLRDLLCRRGAARAVARISWRRIPRRFPLDRLNRREQILRGPIAVGAPGNLGGWCELVRRYGRKKLPELFAPAIPIARDGFGMIEFNVEEYRGVTGELRGHDRALSRMVAQLRRGHRGRPAEARRAAEAARTSPTRSRRWATKAPACSTAARSARRSSSAWPSWAAASPWTTSPTSRPTGSIRSP